MSISLILSYLKNNLRVKIMYNVSLEPEEMYDVM